MKSLFLSMLITLSTATALADTCPTLKGSYDCTGSEKMNPEFTLEITQSTKDGLTTYYTSTDGGKKNEFLADSKVYINEYESRAGFGKVLRRSKVSCENGSLVLLVDDRMPEKKKRAIETTTVTKKGNKLKIVEDTIFKNFDHDRLTFEYTCITREK